MNKEIPRFCTVRSLLIMILLAGCGRESTGPSPNDKTRTEYLWLNETIALAPGRDTTFSRYLITHDTLHITIGLLNQYAISTLYVKNGVDSVLFQEEQVESDHFYVHIPASDTHALFLQQHGELSQFQLYARIIRWEYRP
jgi:hypothetical protein